MVATQRRFRAMGTSVHLVASGGSDDLLERAEGWIRAYERRWSRFVPTSEICQINAAEACPVIVPDDTFSLIALAVAAWYRTRGLFDPTVLRALEASGYRASFELVGPTTRSTPPSPTVGCAQIELDPVLSSVRLPLGVALDLGGIGKGFTADLVGHRLLAEGADAVLVNLGGDLWCGGAPPEDGWTVGVDPGTGNEVARLAIDGGAVATSTTLVRSWDLNGQRTHHLIDPRTGSASTSGVLAATVIAGSAAWAEVLAKVIVIAGVDRAASLLSTNGATGLALMHDGTIEQFDRLTPYLVETAAAS